jgi:tol-pal system protein YbgF
MFRLIFISMLSLLFLASCASSSPDEDSVDAMSEDDARQKELDEIEALLGVERPAEDKKKKSAKDEDTLGLLSSEDVPVKGQGQSSSPQTITPPPPTKSTKELESQIAQKDAMIADLKRQVKNQNIQISQLEASKTAPVNVYAGVSGDIPSEEYEQRYQEGFNLFQSRNYKAAIDLFEALLASSSNHSLSDNAQYWIGESHYALGQYRAAIIYFEKVFTFPKSNKNPDAQFKLGLCYIRLGESDKAREEFQRLLDLYPDSDYVSRAQQHIAEL